MFQTLIVHLYPIKDVEPKNFSKYHKHEMLLLQVNKDPKMLHNMLLYFVYYMVNMYIVEERLVIVFYQIEFYQWLTDELNDT